MADGFKAMLAGFNWRSYAMIIALAVIALIFTWLTNGIFLSPRNVAQLLRQTAILVVVATGVAMLIIQREIDLSIGSAVYLTGLAAATAQTQWQFSTVPAILVALAVGLAIGVWQGFWVSRFRIPSFVVTLSGLLAFRGIGFVWSDAATYAPMSGYQWGHDIRIQGKPEPGPKDDVSADWTRLTPEFFDTIGAQMLTGRAINEDDNGNKNQALYHNLAFGAGIDFRLSSRIKFGVEERIVSPLTGLDMLDGFIGPTNTNDLFAFSTAKLSFDLGNAATHTEPLWWINPNNYLYNEVGTPKHMKLPPVVLPDADGDGVTDQFDMEPNTPAGCAVDVKGVSLDTDGDGVPDCRDKEKLTPTSCFPVNADGVGTCPEPECCKNIKPEAPTCAISSLPSVQFKSGSAALSSTSKTLLDNVAAQLSANPTCKVKLVGYGASDKRAQQLSWDHVNAIKTYLTEQKGISESRVIFTYGMEGTATTVDLVPTMEEGPNTVPAPHPNLRKG